MLSNLPVEWRARPTSEHSLDILQNRLNCSKLLVQLLSIRGYEDPARAQSFLAPDESQFHNPYDLAESEPAAQQILEAVQAGRPIALVGEHSLDGQLSTALLYRLLCQLNGEVRYTIVDENGASEEPAYLEEDETLTVFVGRPPGLDQRLDDVVSREEQAIIIGRKLADVSDRDELTAVDPLGKASRYINHSVPIAGIALKVGEIVLRKKYGEEPPNFVAVDLETTGTTATQDEIIEIGAVRFRRGNPVEEFQTFVSSVTEVPEVIQDLTGLTGEDLKGAPGPAESLEQFTDFLNGEVLVAHNAPFDAGFLHFSMKKYLGKSFLNDYDDSKELARTVLTDLPEHSLKQVCRRLGVDMGTHHRALDDAYSCGEIYVQLRSSNPGPIKNFRRRYLPFVALAALVGQSPLSPENRTMTRIGLNCLDRSPYEGFAYLSRKIREISRESFGLYRGPLTILRLAAREDDGTYLIRLLGEPEVEDDLLDRLDGLTDRWREAKQSANNQVEQALKTSQFDAACIWIELDEVDPYLIDAEITKLSDDLDRAVCVISPREQGGYEALLRTSDPVDLDLVLGEFEEPVRLRDEGACSARFLCSIADLDGLKARVEKKLDPPDSPDLIHWYDMDLDLESLRQISVEELSQMGPFGPGNPRPRFRVRGVNVLHAEPCGPQSVDLNLSLTVDGDSFEAVAPGRGNQAESLPEDQRFDMIIEMARVELAKQKSRPQVLVLDLWEENTGGESHG